MKCLKFLLIAVFCIGYYTVYTQEVVSSGGDYLSAPNVSLSSTIGEPIIETLNSSGGILTQGFQQSRLLVVEIEDLLSSNFPITVYPNPTAFNINIKVETIDNKKLSYKIFDIEGTLIANKEIEALETRVDFAESTSGTYILEIFADQSKIKSFKIIKQ